MDGHAGLRKAVEAWPGVQVQRSARHERVDFVEHCAALARAEMKRECRPIVNAADGFAERKAYEAFVPKGSTLCPAGARSVGEAATELAVEKPRGELVAFGEIGFHERDGHREVPSPVRSKVA